MELPVAALLGRTACRVTLDDIKLCIGGIAIGAIGQFAGQPAAGERGFANRFARFTGRFSCTSGVQSFFHHLFRYRWVRVEVRHQAFVSDGANDALDFSGEELLFRLIIEFGIGMFDRNNSDEAFEQIVTGDLRVLVLQQVVLFGVLVDRPGQGGAESGLVRAAVGIVNGVGVGENLCAIAVVILHNDVCNNVRLFRRPVLHVFMRPLAGERDRLRVQDLFAFAELLDEFLDTVLVIKGFAFSVRDTLIEERDLEV